MHGCPSCCLFICTSNAVAIACAPVWRSMWTRLRFGGATHSLRSLLLWKGIMTARGSRWCRWCCCYCLDGVCSSSYEPPWLLQTQCLELLQQEWLSAKTSSKSTKHSDCRVLRRIAIERRMTTDAQGARATAAILGAQQSRRGPLHQKPAGRQRHGWIRRLFQRLPPGLTFRHRHPFKGGDVLCVRSQGSTKFTE